MRVRVSYLEASGAVRMKIGARGISVAEARQLLVNRYETRPNPRDRGRVRKRLVLVGRTNGGRRLTVVIEPTCDPALWQIVTAWEN